MTQIHTSGLWAAPWLLLVLPLLLRALPWGRGALERPPAWRVDLPLGAAAAVVVALSSTMFLSHPLTEYFPLSAADFGQYCELVARVAVGDVEQHTGVRMPGPAVLPAALIPWVGLIDGLAIQSFLALVATCGGLYLWGLVLHGRLAGLCTVVLVGGILPLAFLSRDLSFYPVVVASSVVSAAGVASMVRFRGPSSAALTGLAVAVLLLTDVRGVLFAAPLLALSLLFSVVRARAWRFALVRLALVLAPVVASWFVARAVVPSGLTGLQMQAVMYADQAVHNAGEDSGILAPLKARAEREPGFVWGHRSPIELAATFGFLRELTARIPPAVRDSEQNRRMRADHLTPWVLPGMVSLVICVLGLWRQRWRLAALLLCIGPFLSMLWATGQVLPQERHLATGLAVLPLLMGIAVAVLAGAHAGSGGGDSAPAPRSHPWRYVLLVGAIAAALCGLPPTWLGHRAGWRRGIVQSEPRTVLQAVHDGGRDGGEHCSEALARGRADPHWPSRLYPRARRVLDGSDTQPRGHWMVK